MCFNGVTYCIKRRHIQKRLDCGYTLGGCNEQQTAACNNIPVATTVPSCACTAPIETLTLRYIGPYNQTVEANAKKNCILINTFSNILIMNIHWSRQTSQMKYIFWFVFFKAVFYESAVKKNCLKKTIF